VYKLAFVEWKSRGKCFPSILIVLKMSHNFSRQCSLLILERKFITFQPKTFSSYHHVSKAPSSSVLVYLHNLPFEILSFFLVLLNHYLPKWWKYAWLMLHKRQWNFVVYKGKKFEAKYIKKFFLSSKSLECFEKFLLSSAKENLTF
jgi:hypothetical protein